MNPARADSPAAPEPRRAAGWPLRRWLTLIALVFAAHVVLIITFGEKKPGAPRPVADVPRLALADNSSELIALGDPTLFALPRAGDFAAVRLPAPVGEQPSFRWTTEPPAELASPAAGNLGEIFNQFMQTNQFAAFPLDFKPEPELNEPEFAVAPALPEKSALQILGGLARRILPGEINLPLLPCDDVIAPSRVQVLVDAAGNVVSAVLLPPDNAVEAAGRAAIGDTNALQIARTLRFAPAERPAVGELIFNWRTVPVTTTNGAASE